MSAAVNGAQDDDVTPEEIAALLARQVMRLKKQFPGDEIYAQAAKWDFDKTMSRTRCNALIAMIDRAMAIAGDATETAQGLAQWKQETLLTLSSMGEPEPGLLPPLDEKWLAAHAKRGDEVAVLVLEAIKRPRKKVGRSGGTGKANGPQAKERAKALNAAVNQYLKSPALMKLPFQDAATSLTTKHQHPVAHSTLVRALSKASKALHKLSPA